MRLTAGQVEALEGRPGSSSGDSGQQGEERAPKRRRPLGSAIT